MHKAELILGFSLLWRAFDKQVISGQDTRNTKETGCNTNRIPRNRLPRILKNPTDKRAEETKREN
jgi:hypothetical protein